MSVNTEPVVDVTGRAGAENVKSARRALEILELLTARRSALSFTQIAEELDYPRSSLHGLLRTLTDSGWLALDRASRRYSLGIKVLEAGHAYTATATLAELARPQLERVRDALNETAQLAILDDRYALILAEVQGEQRLALSSSVGRRLEAHATAAGKVLLAGLAPTDFERLLVGLVLERLTPATTTDLERLRLQLHEIQRRGYGLDREEYTAGVRSLAVPIYDHVDRTIAAMSVSVPVIRFDRRTQQRARQLLSAGAEELSRTLGRQSASRDRE